MIIDADDFGRYGFDESVAAGNYRTFAGTLVATHTRKSTASLSLGILGRLAKVVGFDTPELGFSYAYYMDGLPSQTGTMVLAEWRDNNNLVQCGVAVMASGKILAYRGDVRIAGFSGFANVYGESDRPVMTTNGFNYVEAYAYVDSVDGAIEVRINGVTALNLAGINTQGIPFLGYPDPETNVIAICAHGAVAAGIVGFPNTWMTDPIWWDKTGTDNNDFMGDKYVGSQMADGDTPTAQWVPVVPGPHYEMVNNVPPLDDAEHVTAWATGKQDAYTLADLPAEVVAINAVIPFIRSEKTDASDMRVKISALSGAAQADGPEEVLTTSWRYYDMVVERDPDTDAPWTVAGFNDSQILITRTV